MSPQSIFVMKNATPISSLSQDFFEAKSDPIPRGFYPTVTNRLLHSESDCSLGSRTCESQPCIKSNSSFYPVMPRGLSIQFHKTRLCPFFARGHCQKGVDCTYAHDQMELRVAPDLYKTKLCEQWQKGNCNHLNCKFAHGRQELRYTGLVYKTRLCHFFLIGDCNKGNLCRHAHGYHELRNEEGQIIHHQSIDDELSPNSISNPPSELTFVPFKDPIDHPSTGQLNTMSERDENNECSTIDDCTHRLMYTPPFSASQTSSLLSLGSSESCDQLMNDYKENNESSIDKSIAVLMLKQALNALNLKGEAAIQADKLQQMVTNFIPASYEGVRTPSPIIRYTNRFKVSTPVKTTPITTLHHSYYQTGIVPEQQMCFHITDSHQDVDETIRCSRSMPAPLDKEDISCIYVPRMPGCAKNFNTDQITTNCRSRGKKWMVSEISNHPNTTSQSGIPNHPNTTSQYPTSALPLDDSTLTSLINQLILDRQYQSKQSQSSSLTMSQFDRSSPKSLLSQFSKMNIGNLWCPGSELESSECPEGILFEDELPISLLPSGDLISCGLSQQSPLRIDIPQDENKELPFIESPTVENLSQLTSSSLCGSTDWEQILSQYSSNV